MGNKVHTCVKYGCCQVCQHPGCCCCCVGLCKYTRCGGDCLWCANHLPCCICFRIPVEKSVFLAGREGSGKTTLLYYLMLQQKYLTAAPTKGFNNEVVTFNRWQMYEFWDVGGSAVQRKLWAKFYSTVHFHIVIYVVDGQAWRKADDVRRETVLLQDRMELHALLNEEDLDLTQTKFLVFVNFFKEYPKDASKVVEEIEDELELVEYPSVVVTSDYEVLKDEMGVQDDEMYHKTLCCPT